MYSERNAGSQTNIFPVDGGRRSWLNSRRVHVKDRLQVAICEPVEVDDDGDIFGRRGLVICELQTGELAICELIVRTTNANLEYSANQKVRINRTDRIFVIARTHCMTRV